jgi:hypothetical protein
VGGAEGGAAVHVAVESLAGARAARVPLAHLVDHIGVVRPAVLRAEERHAMRGVAIEGRPVAVGPLASALGRAAVLLGFVGLAECRTARAVAVQCTPDASLDQTALVRRVNMIWLFVEKAKMYMSFPLAIRGATMTSLHEFASRMTEILLADKAMYPAVASIIRSPSRSAEGCDP